MKTYVITLSQQFPKGHRRAGEPTRFRCAFLQGRDICRDCLGGCNYDGNAEAHPGRTCSRNLWTYHKIHTIRANYPLWKKRFEEIECGAACLSIRQWTGKPYRSPQVEIGRLTKSDGIGIQILSFPDGDISAPIVSDGRRVMLDLDNLSRNDGLSYSDWYKWFEKYDHSKPMAIIHFTSFRY